MGGSCIGVDDRRIPRESFYYINSRLTQEGVTAHQYFQFCSGRGVLPQKSKVINEPVGELYLVSPWVNIDNYDINYHGVRGFGVRGGGNIRFYPIPPFTLNIYLGPSGEITLVYGV